MSIHPTLKGVQKGAVQRSVFSRIERIRLLLQKGTWKEGDSVIGLPKIKVVRVKFKKEKAEKVPAEAAAAGIAVPAAAEAGKSAAATPKAAVAPKAAATPKAK